jgi:hypothetical protein
MRDLAQIYFGKLITYICTRSLQTLKEHDVALFIEYWNKIFFVFERHR